MPVGATPQPRPSGPRNGFSPGQADFDTVLDRQSFIAGTPQTVIDYLDRYESESKCNYFVASFQWGDLTNEEASSSLELFTKEVMPRFTKSRLRQQ